MFYGQMGGKDLLVRKWKGLADYVTLVCDGQDLTGRLKQLRVHAILFLNISRLVHRPLSIRQSECILKTSNDLIENFYFAVMAVARILGLEALTVSLHRPRTA